MTSDTESPENISDNSKDSFSTKFMAIIRAFIANIIVSLIKLFCWYITKSSAMLAEAVHSGVDSFNSICLLVGLKRGSKPADREHQFGYGLETNIWTIIASILMLIGSAIALHSAYEKIWVNNNVSDLLNNYHVMAFVLLMTICSESWAVNSAVQAILKEANIDLKNPVTDFIKSIKYVRKSNSPTTKFVWFEDVIALSGVVIAFIAVTISKFVLSEDLAHIPDGIASGIIALMLIFLAIYMLKNNVNFLTGLSAEPQTEDIIRNIANNLHGISKVRELKTMDMGASGLIVNITIEVDSDIQVKDANDIAEMLERKIRKYIKNISHVAVEIESNDAEENWENKFDKIIQEGEKISIIDKHEANMLGNFYNFAQTVVKEVLVPRNKVSFIDINENLTTLIDLIIESGHTRIPVYEDTVDNLVGVINAKDVLKAVRDKADDNPDFKIKTLVREILIIPENKFISDLLSDFTSTNNQIAAVVDEHGGIAGIVTVEDIIEEIVGEIYDEFDETPTPELIKIDDYTLNISSQMDIEDINEKYDLDIPNEDFQTIGGYVFGLIGREPELHDKITDKNLQFEVIELDGIRISRVLMKKQTPFIDKTEIQESSNENEEL